MGDGHLPLYLTHTLCWVPYHRKRLVYHPRPVGRLLQPPFTGANHTWYMDGSSLIHEGQRKAGAAIVTETWVVWSQPLPAGTSAQKAEMMALTKALTLGKDLAVNVYMDSRYALP